MKQITIKIPTTLYDVRDIVRERTNRRYRHNKKVVTDMYNTILLRMKGNYWSADVSQYFRENFEHMDFNGTKGLLSQTLNKLK